jgi:hypothetical protein
MGAKSSKADPAPEPEEPPTKKQKTETPMSPTTPKPKPKKLKTFLEAMKKSEMQALADALEVTYAKGDKAEDLAAKIAKGLNRPSGFKATLSTLKGALRHRSAHAHTHHTSTRTHTHAHGDAHAHTDSTTDSSRRVVRSRHPQVDARRERAQDWRQQGGPRRPHHRGDLKYLTVARCGDVGGEERRREP